MGTVRIPLSSRKHPNLFAIVDEEDAPRILQFTWHIEHSTNRVRYARRIAHLPDGTQRSIRMHRFIANAGQHESVDHINGNGLDNRRANLRVANKSQNGINAAFPVTNTSGYKGVSFCARTGKWHAKIEHYKKSIFLGSFDTSEAAASAYDEMAREIHGEFARLNFPRSGERSAR